MASSLNLILSSIFFLFEHGLFLTYVPLGNTVAFTVSTSLYHILGKNGHERSQGGRQPAAAKPPLYNIPCIVVCVPSYLVNTTRGMMEADAWALVLRYNAACWGWAIGKGQPIGQPTPTIGLVTPTLLELRDILICRRLTIIKTQVLPTTPFVKVFIK